MNMLTGQNRSNFAFRLCFSTLATVSNAKSGFNIEDLKAYMSLSVEEKLIYLEEINSFLAEVVPDKSKKAWEKLKQEGW